MNYNEAMSSNTAQTLQNNEYSIFNPGPVCRTNEKDSNGENSRLNSVCSIDSVKQELKKCGYAFERAIKNFSPLFSDSKLSVMVYEDAINHIGKELRAKTPRRSSSYDKTIRLYCLLRVLNMAGLIYVCQEDLIRATGGGKKKNFNLAIKDLVAVGLVRENVLYNNLSGRTYNAYCAYPFNYEIVTKDSIIEYTYDATSLYKYQQCKCVLLDKSFLPTNQCDDAEVPAPSFRAMFTGWYDELLIMSESEALPASRFGHFSPKDGRFYHLFHQLPRAIRESRVWWDGECLIEKWDANASFFLVMCYTLRNRDWKNDWDRRKIFKETQHMAELCLRGEFYCTIQNYYNRNSKYKKTREEIKVLCHTYKAKYSDYLFKKDGTYKNYPYVQKLIPIDSYFKENFPSIREYILNSEVIIEKNPDYRMLKEKRNGTLYRDKSEYKRISALLREVMPNEFRLISEGVCGVLYDQYGIKAITVHDAIYMKKSDVMHCPDINNILRRLLNLPQPTIFNPAYSDGYVAAEPVMYQFNVNTPAITQLRV